jgi:D-alanyl-D-alanine carboxypeptidase
MNIKILAILCSLSFPWTMLLQDGTPRGTAPAIPENSPHRYSIEELMGKFDPTQHPDFVVIEARYASRTGMYLRKETYEAFKKMHAAAAKDSIQLRIISATRNFEAQKGIWEAKWTGARTIENGKNAATAYPDPIDRALKILEYSAMPGSSRHHWGTDIDLNDLNPAWFRNGQGKKIHDWLTQNGPKFGFCQPYSPKGKERPYGYNEEHWHWSYMPIAQQMARLASEKLKNEMIQGFAGSNTAPKIDVVGRYVLGINQDCSK